MSIIKDFTVKNLTPNVPAIYKHLLPTVLKQESCSFIINGCSNAVSNAIRRTIISELKVAHLQCEYEDIETDDPFIIPEMIQKRLRMIPLHQSVNSGSVFSLSTTNNEVNVQDVKTALISGSGKKPLFDETITLLTLGAGKFLRINNIKVAHEYGYVQNYGMCAVAFNAVSICKDVTPINTFESNEGARSQMADPRVWEVKFNTNGTMSSRDIVRAACDEIMDRLKKVISLLYTIVNNENKYTMTIQGESDTIGNLLVKTIDEMYPDVEAATYHVPAIERSLVVKIIYSDDIDTLFKNVVNKLLDVFAKIKENV